MLGIWEAYRDKNLNRQLLLSYGYGDGGGGVNREMLEMRRRLAELPGVPQVTTDRADEYFAELEKTVEASDQYVHTWDGELYLELHRGTYTSQAYNKRMNRKLELLYRETEWLELLYRETEWLDVLAGIQAGKPIEHKPDARLQEGWKIILRNQFHDIIPGSSIRQVYEDSRVEYAEAERLGLAVRGAAASSLAEGVTNRKGLTVFNSSPWERTEIIEVPAAIAGEFTSWTTPQDGPCQVQRSEQARMADPGTCASPDGACNACSVACGQRCGSSEYIHSLPQLTEWNGHTVLRAELGRLRQADWSVRQGVGARLPQASSATSCRCLRINRKASTKRGISIFSIRRSSPVTAWRETDLMERPVSSLRSGPIRLEIAPYEIKTLWIKF